MSLRIHPCSPRCALPDRCDEAASTITLLGGISLLHASPSALHLKLVTAYPTAAVRAGMGGTSSGWCDPGPCAAADHELSVHLHSGRMAGGNWWGSGGGCDRPQMARLCAKGVTCLPGLGAGRVSRLGLH